MGGISQMGRSSSTPTTAALIAAMLMMTTMTTLFTATHCGNYNQTSWLIADVDLDSELMMDSEISRRTLATINYAETSSKKNKPASCDRQDKPNCNPPKNSKPLPPNCDTYNRDCHKY